MSKPITLLAIDPGPIKSAVVVLSDGKIQCADILENNELLGHLRAAGPWTVDHLAVEMIASYGMPVGKDVFETVLWIGRFIERCCAPFTKVYRKDVKLHLCGSARAKDGNIRQALIDRYGGTEAIGKKANPGPLYGISKDMWSALAVGVTWLDTTKEGGLDE